MESSNNPISVDWDALRAPLAAVVQAGDTRFDSDLGLEAFATALIVASQLPGGEPLVAWYEPDVPAAELAVEVPDDLPPLALRALGCLVGEEAEWHGPWDAGGFKDAAEAVGAVRAILERATG